MIVTYDVFSHPSQKEGGNSSNDSNFGGTPLVLIKKLLLFVVIGPFNPFMTDMTLLIKQINNVVVRGIFIFQGLKKKNK